VGDDSDLILDCAAAILKGTTGAETLLELNGNQVRTEFPRVQNGIRGAIDFLRTQLNVFNLKLLPYPLMLAPLAAFFAEPDGKEVIYDGKTFETLKRWFWRSCFTARYASQTRRTATIDIQEMENLKAGRFSKLDNIHATVQDDFFFSAFRVGTAVTKTFVVMLANNNPRSFLSGKLADLDKVLQRYNRSEFHHIYPRAHLKERDDVGDHTINTLVNFCFLSTAENKVIGRKAPSVYVKDIPESSRAEILSSAFCGIEDFDDDFKMFFARRCRRLAAFANSLTRPDLDL
jgi:hypothetical protein